MNRTIENAEWRVANLVCGHDAAALRRGLSPTTPGADCVFESNCRALYDHRLASSELRDRFLKMSSPKCVRKCW